MHAWRQKRRGFAREVPEVKKKQKKKKHKIYTGKTATRRKERGIGWGDGI